MSIYGHDVEYNVRASLHRTSLKFANVLSILNLMMQTFGESELPMNILRSVVRNLKWWQNSLFGSDMETISSSETKTEAKCSLLVYEFDFILI